MVTVSYTNKIWIVDMSTLAIYSFIYLTDTSDNHYSCMLVSNYTIGWLANDFGHSAHFTIIKFEYFCKNFIMSNGSLDAAFEGGCDFIETRSVVRQTNWTPSQKPSTCSMWIFTLLIKEWTTLKTMPKAFLNLFTEF